MGTAVIGALVCAHVWQFELMPGTVSSPWGPYIVAVLGWVVAAAIALRMYHGAQSDSSEHVPRTTVLVIAGLVGLFIVSLQVITGMVASFGRSPYAHSPDWLLINAFFAGAPLAAVEMSRAALLRWAGMHYLTLGLLATSIGLAVIEFPLRRYEVDGFASSAGFWGAELIPLVAIGLIAGFFSLYGGYLGALLVSAPLVAFTYFSPFLPVAPWPIMALIGVAGPACGLWIAESLFEADEDPPEEVGQVPLPSIAWVLTAVVGLSILWFSFGFFGYRPSFVPSHSMEPFINQGDVVLIGPTEPDDVKVGQVVAYEMPGGRQVLHRVMDITSGENGERQFIFKGDNNNAEDLSPVVDEQIVGRYIGRIPRLGWIPIKFNEWFVEPFR
jgi:signal peptidase